MYGPCDARTLQRYQFTLRTRIRISAIAVDIPLDRYRRGIRYMRKRSHNIVQPVMAVVRQAASSTAKPKINSACLRREDAVSRPNPELHLMTSLIRDEERYLSHPEILQWLGFLSQMQGTVQVGRLTAGERKNRLTS